RNPRVVMSPVTAPLRSSSAFVAVVVPWTTIWSWPGVASVPASAARTPSAWLRGVVGTLATRTAPVASSSKTRSVKVPPTSTPTRSARPAVTTRGSSATSGAPVGRSRSHLVRDELRQPHVEHGGDAVAPHRLERAPNRRRDLARVLHLLAVGAAGR